MPIIKNPDGLDYDHLEKLYEKKFFETYIPKVITSRRYEEIKVSQDKLTFKLIDREQRDTVSLIHGEINTYHKVEYFEVIWTYSRYTQRGFLTYLFEFLIFEFDYKLLSDKYHTSPGSKEFWQSLMRKKRYNIYRLNLDTNYKRKAHNYNEEKIWGNEGEVMFLDELNDLNSFDNDSFNDESESEYIDDIIDTMKAQTENVIFNNNFSEHSTKSTTDNISKERIRLIAQK